MPLAKDPEARAQQLENLSRGRNTAGRPRKPESVAVAIKVPRDLLEEVDALPGTRTDWVVQAMRERLERDAEKTTHKKG